LDLDPTDQGRSERGEAHLGFQLAREVAGGEVTAQMWTPVVFLVVPEAKKTRTGCAWMR
jgi:hypothetical protein